MLRGSRWQRRPCTFTLQQEVSPEGDDGRLPVRSLLPLRQVDGKELANRLSHEAIRCLAENTAERQWEELRLDQIRWPKVSSGVCRQHKSGLVKCASIQRENKDT